MNQPELDLGNLKTHISELDAAVDRAIRARSAAEEAEARVRELAGSLNRIGLRSPALRVDDPERLREFVSQRIRLSAVGIITAPDLVSRYLAWLGVERPRTFGLQALLIDLAKEIHGVACRNDHRTFEGKTTRVLSGCEFSDGSDA